MINKEITVVCVGQAVYDLVLTVDHHPAADEKLVASSLMGWGGGPAANAAVTAARLGLGTAFCGYLGQDHYGDLHFAELQAEGVDTSYLTRGAAPTPLSVALVKPNGQRSLVNFRRDTPPLPPRAIDLPGLAPSAILFDGLEPDLSPPLAAAAREQGVPTILDAGSVHPGTITLLGAIDYLVCSEKFAYTFTGEKNEPRALASLRAHAPTVVITLGARGLVWAQGPSTGRLPAFEVVPVDTNGAGDVFHGAFAAGVATGKPWKELLTFAAAAAALSCTRMGGRPAIPTATELHNFLAQ
jgi:sulfofructose kinase